MSPPRFSVLSLLLVAAGAAALLAMPIALLQYIHGQRPGWREILLPIIAVPAWCAFCFWLNFKASTGSRVFLAGWLAGALAEFGAFYLSFTNGWVSFGPTGWLPQGWFPCTIPLTRAIAQFDLFAVERVMLPAFIGGMMATGCVCGAFALILYRTHRGRMNPRKTANPAPPREQFTAHLKRFVPRLSLRELLIWTALCALGAAIAGKPFDDDLPYLGIFDRQDYAYTALLTIASAAMILGLLREVALLLELARSEPVNQTKAARLTAPIAWRVVVAFLTTLTLTTEFLVR